MTLHSFRNLRHLINKTHIAFYVKPRLNARVSLKNISNLRGYTSQTFSFFAWTYFTHSLFLCFQIVRPSFHHWTLIHCQQLTILLEHLVVQTTEHCFTQMELYQLQHKQVVLQQLNGVDRMVWNVGKVGLFWLTIEMICS